MIIGIGGVSRSGKSSLAEGLARHCRAKGKRVAIIHQDAYVHPEADIPRIRDRVDWEAPASIDFTSFGEAIGESARTNDVVIAEGLLAFYDEAVDRRYDHRFFLEIGHDTFRERKGRDDRWGDEPDWYIEHIWESYLRFGQPRDPEQVVFIDGEKEPDWPRILATLKKQKEP